MRIEKRPADPTNGAHKNGDNQVMRSSRDPKELEEKKEKMAQKKETLTENESARGSETRTYCAAQN